MANGSGIDLQGLSDLVNNIQRLTGQAAEQAQTVALKKAGETVAAKMGSKVNRSSKSHKHIGDDIKVGSVKTGEGGVKYIDIGPSKKTSWRAKFLEFGTVKMRAKPFIQNSLIESSQEAMEIMAEELRKVLAGP